MRKLSILPSIQFCISSLSCAAISLLSPQIATAATFELSFTALEGIINVNPLNNAGTAIYRASLSDVGFDITAINISDIIALAGGSPGKFSGFDLDAIKISDRLITIAEDVKTIPGLNVFDFTSDGTIFFAGTKRDPGSSIFAPYFVGNDLFGSKDGIIDNTVATLGSFDANAITNQDARGYVSLGDGGEIYFKLREPLSTATPLYVYIGEVGNNGEQARGRVMAIGNATTTTSIPEPTSLGALSFMGLYFTTRIKKKRKWHNFG